MSKSTEFRRIIEAEIPRRSLSPRAVERVEETYRMLGVQKEPQPAKARRSKKAWIVSVSAVAASFILLFGTNAAFPALAEELPVVGRFFRAINSGTFQTYGEMVKKPMATYLDTYALQDVSGETAVSESGDFTMTAKQAFCDGEFVSVSLTLDAPAGTVEQYKYICADQFSAAVNGEAAKTFSQSYLYPQEDGTFTGVATVRLPHAVENGQTVQMALSLGALEGQNQTTKDTMVPLEGSFSPSFSVTADTSYNREVSLESGEDNGAKILGYKSTPSYFRLEVVKPYWGFVEGISDAGFPALYLEDGTELDFNSQGTDELGYDAWAGQEQTAPLLFTGVPAGTESVIFRFYQDYNEDQVLAEFTIDLENGAAAPSRTYESTGDLGIDSPFHYKYLDSSYQKPDGKFKNGYFATQMIFSAPDGNFSLHISTPEEYREIEAVLSCADGTVIGSTVSQYGTLYENENWFWDENSQFWDTCENNPYHAYRLSIDSESGYQPAIGEVLTVTLKDAKTGEVIMSQELTMSETSY